MRWLDSITNSADKNLRTPQETVEDTGARGAAIHGGHEELDTTKRLNNNKCGKTNIYGTVSRPIALFLLTIT